MMVLDELNGGGASLLTVSKRQNYNVRVDNVQRVPGKLSSTNRDMTAECETHVRNEPILYEAASRTDKDFLSASSGEVLK